jgi:hypothetical protein
VGEDETRRPSREETGRQEAGENVRGLWERRRVMCVYARRRIHLGGVDCLCGHLLSL